MQLRYLAIDRDRHGNQRIYVRRRGRRCRIRSKPGSPEFFEEYSKALAKLEAQRSCGAPRGTFDWLCQQYMSAPEFKRLDQKTRAVRRSILNKLCQQRDSHDLPNGGKRYEALRARHIRRWRDARSDHPEAANAIIRALRPMFKWAIEAELADANPAKDVPYIRTRSDGFHTWTEDEVRRFEDRWPVGTRERLALALLMYTGVRRSDVVGLGRQHAKDGWHHFRTKKGNTALSQPILPELQAALDAGPCGDMTYLVTAYGKPFSIAGFGNWFREACDKAGVPGRAHGLRKIGAVRAAENGATEKELMAIFGWETMQQAAHYTKRASQARLAGRGMHKLGKNLAGTQSVPPPGDEVSHRKKTV